MLTCFQLQNKLKKRRYNKLERKMSNDLKRNGEEKKWTFKHWSEEEHSEFTKAVRRHGKNFDEIMKAVKTKTKK